jgi:hypothetical protein
MTTAARLACVALVAALAAACAHAREQEPPTADRTSPPKDRPAEAAHPPPPGAAPPHDRPDEGASLPVASSPAALLNPGAAKQIRDKLAGRGLLSPTADDNARGLDAGTSEALLRFQRESDLPATGVPDDATVRKLGLSPDDVFRR